jgi:hypothetical protein
MGYARAKAVRGNASRATSRFSLFWLAASNLAIAIVKPQQRASFCDLPDMPQDSAGQYDTMTIKPPTTHHCRASF